MIRTAVTLLGSSLGAIALRFVRNILVARLLSVEDFGVASTFAIIFALFEMIGALGVERLLVQARDGDEPKVQATLHAIQVLRGPLAALVLYLTAAPLADLMQVPHTAWAFQLMALIPLIQGLGHLDTSRSQRAMNFGPFIKTTLGAECATLLALYPLYLAFGDYRVGLYSIFVQQIALVVLSHGVALRGYRLGIDREVFLRALRFGWPLLLNTLLMFGIFQGDRIIVANRLGAVELGLFSLAFTLTFLPTSVLIQTLNRLFLPKLAALQDDPEAFARLARIAVQAGLVVGLMVATGFALFGPDAVLLVFGEKYAGALAVLIWFAIMHAVRVAKFGISTIALAKAETRSPMIANSIRVLLLPLAWLALDRGAGLTAVVWIAIVGELMGVAVAFALLRHLLNISLEGLGLPVLLWAGVLALIALDTGLSPPHPVLFANFHWPQLAIVMAFVAAVLGMSDLRRWVFERLSFRTAATAARAGKDRAA